MPRLQRRDVQNRDARLHEEIGDCRGVGSSADSFKKALTLESQT
jgi:hypothetical protein